MARIRKPKGYFIVVESTIDGCGKSTVTQMVADYFRAIGRNVYLTHEPGGSSIGGPIRQLLLDPELELDPAAELLLFLADRAQNSSEIKKKLKDGYIVITDRYSFSSVVYQGLRFPSCKCGPWRKVIKYAQRNLVPDLMIVLDMPVSKMKERLQGKKADRFERLGEDFFKDIRDRALYILKCRWDYYWLATQHCTIESEDNPMGTFGKIAEQLDAFMAEKRREEEEALRNRR